MPVTMTNEVPELLGTPEWRGIDDFEVRKQGDEFLVRGYASVFDSEYEVMGGPSAGGFIEVVDRGAFNRTLAAKPDVHFLINHEGRSLARTKSGTLTLSTDKTGLLSEARIDRRTNDGRDLEISLERGDLDEMSFAFRTVQHKWSEDDTLRTLLEVNIDKGDVSVVNNGANPATRIKIADVRAALKAFRSADLAEIRSLDDPAKELREVRDHLTRLIAEIVPPDQRPLTVAEAALLIGQE